MCTLTVVPNSGGVRVAFNRDELRSRPLATAPLRHQIHARTAVYPIDPASNGTWLAATDAGLVMAVLNVNRTDAVYHGRVSRGTIIPSLLASPSMEDVIKVARELDLVRYDPFHLVVMSRDLVGRLVWNGRASAVFIESLASQPMMFTSSGLGDHRVEGVRSMLFQTLLEKLPIDWSIAQDEFHRHRWPEHPELSVNMCRADACTVSYSVVDVGLASTVFTYHPDAPDCVAKDTIVDIQNCSAGLA